MKQKGTPQPILKLNTQLVSFPTAIIKSCTSEFPMECFGKELHLSQSVPLYGNSTNCYSGVPARFVISAINVRFQIIRNVSISVVVYNRGSVCLKFQMDKTVDIAPQETFTLPLVCKPFFPGDIKIDARCTFFFDNANQEIMWPTTFPVEPSLKAKSIVKDDMVEFAVENVSPYPVKNLLAIAGNQKLAVSANLDSGETASVIFKLPTPIKQVDCMWHLPTCGNCTMAFVVEGKQPKPALPISIVFEDTPSTVSALHPFEVTVVITNNTDAPTKGELKFDEHEQSILSYGEKITHFDLIQPKQSIRIKILLIATKQGSFTFPSIQVILKSQNPFSIPSTTGIIVYGKDNC